MDELTLVVLAAGLGMRYGGLKQIEPLGPNGEILIDYSLYDARLSGFSKVVFIVKEELKDTFHEVIGKRTSRTMKVEYAIQSQNKLLPDWFTTPASRGQKPWGTAHALLCTEEVVDGPFAVINSDDFYGRESFRILADFLTSNEKNRSPFALVPYILANTLSKSGYVTRGICKDDGNGHLAEIVERYRVGTYGDRIAYRDENGEIVSVSADSLVSMNIWALTPAVFPLFKEERERFFRNMTNPDVDEFLLPTTMDSLIKRGEARVDMLRTYAVWHGVTYREDREWVRTALNSMHREGIYPALK